MVFSTGSINKVRWLQALLYSPFSAGTGAETVVMNCMFYSTAYLFLYRPIFIHMCGQNTTLAVMIDGENRVQ